MESSSGNGKGMAEAYEEVEEEANFESDEIERNKVGIMRALVEREDPSSKDVDDFMIRRFLRARDLDIEKATNMFLKYLSWKKSFVPNGSISESEIPSQLAQNKLFMQGVDKTGRPIVVVYGGRHKQTTPEEFKRFVAYTIDKICSRMPAGKEKFVSIADLEGWGYTNSDVRGYIAALTILQVQIPRSIASNEILNGFRLSIMCDFAFASALCCLGQDCYPERLGKLFLVHVPYVFMTAWKMVYPFIDNKTKKKILFVENKKTELNPAERYRREPAPRCIWRQTAISSHPELLASFL